MIKRQKKEAKALEAADVAKQQNVASHYENSNINITLRNIVEQNHLSMPARHTKRSNVRDSVGEECEKAQSIEHSTHITQVQHGSSSDWPSAPSSINNGVLLMILYSNDLSPNLINSTNSNNHPIHVRYVSTALRTAFHSPPNHGGQQQQPSTS